MPTRLKPLLATAAAIATLGMAAPAVAAPNVVASIKPVHSLVARVMQGVGTPDLLVKGAGSPHTYALRPSEAEALQNADLVFWIGHDLELFLEDALASVAGDAEVVALDDAPGVTTLPMREGGAFEAHDHEEHQEHGEDEHAHEEEHGHDEAHDDHDHAEEHEHEDEHAEEHGHDEHQHEHEADHAHEGGDPHIWLDPQNAGAMVTAIAEALEQADPENAATYHGNAEAALDELAALSQTVDERLTAVRGKPFVVFHDGYQYFENAFDIAAAGTITVTPGVMPGVQRLSEIQEKLHELGAACVFAEPQFEPKLIAVVTEGTEAKSGVLDPLGADIEDGPALYDTLLTNMADALAGCLGN